MAVAKTRKATARKQVGLTETQSKQFPWILKYKGRVVAGSIFSAVLFGYVDKHESTRHLYEVVKNPKYTA